jgi:hypothetical protein
MLKTFLLLIISGWLIVACGNLDIPVPTSTTVPSPTSAPIPLEPTLIDEIDLETQTGTAYGLDWSPDGQTLAAASGFEITLISKDLKEIQEVLKPEKGAMENDLPL